MKLKSRDPVGRAVALFQDSAGSQGKEKVSRNRPEGTERGTGIAPLFLDLGTRRGWVVSTTPRPLYPRTRPGTHCIGGWVGPRAGLDVCEKSRPHRDLISGSSNP
jgi:hypothetical protein